MTQVFVISVKMPLLNKKFQKKTLQRRLDPIIQYVKQLAGSIQESDVYVLCQTGKRICNLSGKRTLAQLFEKLGEENENYLSEKEITTAKSI